MNNQIFDWGNYEEDPKGIAALKTISSQKDATYNEASNGVFTGNIEESFFTNTDKTLVPEVASVIGEEPMELVFGKGEVKKFDYSKQPFTVRITQIQDSNNSIYLDGFNDLEYSTDGGLTWFEQTEPVYMERAGKTIMYRGNGNQEEVHMSLEGEFRFDVEGNIMSLLYGNDFVGKTSLSNTAMDTTLKLSYFFAYAPVVNAKNLVLPATTLAESCYQQMFEGCASLTTVPVLPATTLADGCYQSMFYGCISLTTAPELRATTLAESCYQSMFYCCTSLTTVPVLPATTLAEGCYSNMFYGCISLTTAPELRATTLAEGCYSNMFSGCISLTTAPELRATTLAEDCYLYMFSGCASLTTAPELPATTLAEGCYLCMFEGCTSLTTVPVLPATTLAEGCYSNMFSGCTSLTTVPVLPATTLAEGCYSNMFSGCNSLNYIKCMATDITAGDCTSGWVDGVAENGTFIKDSSMSGWTTGSDGIPSGWTVEDAA